MKRMGTAGLAAVATWVGFGATAGAQTASASPPVRTIRSAAVKAEVSGSFDSARSRLAQDDGAVEGRVRTTGKRAMTFRDLMAMKRVSDPQISPSGRWVLFTVTDVDLEKNTKTDHLWVVPIDGSAPERQVTFGEGESFGRFSPDGRWVSSTQNPGKEESFARIAIAAWDENTGAIGAAKPLEGVSGDADGAVWSPDARHFLFTTEVWPECSVVLIHAQTARVNGALRAQDAGRTERSAETGSRASGSFDSARSRLAQDDSPVGGIEISGTNNVAAWRVMEPAGWADEDACDRAKDEAAEKNPVKAQVWDGLLYRHWDHWTGAKRTHILVADVSDPTHDNKAVVNGPPGDSRKTNTGVLPLRLVPLAQGQDDGEVSGSNPPKQSLGGAPGVMTVRDVTTARDVGDAETPTWMLGGPQEYAWAPDGKEIAYVANLDLVPAASTNNDVFTLRVDEPDAKPVKVSTSAGSDDEPEYSPDGRWLAFRSQRQAGFESDRERLMLAERCGGNRDQGTGISGCGREWGEAKELMPKFDRWVDEFTWAPVSEFHDGIFFAAGDRGEENLYSVRVGGVGPSAGGQTAVQWTGGSEISSPALGVLPRLADGFRISGNLAIVVLSMKIDQPAELLSVFPTDAGSVAHPDELGVLYGGNNPTRLVTHFNDSVLSQLDMNPLEPFWFTGAEGTKVEGFLLKPPGFDPKKKYPLKFILHGGPQTALGDSWSYRWNFELMAASGYVVIGINRRGSTGYGQKFVDEVSGDWGGRAYEDLMKGLDYAEAKFPFIDKTRECALGASYGGYMADWVLTHTNRFKCIVMHDGAYDLGSMYGSTEEMWFAEWEFRRPEDFPKGWDGFTGGYNPMGKTGAAVRTVPSAVAGSRASGSFDSARPRLAQDDGEKQTTTTAKANAGVPPLRPAGRDSAQDDGEKQRRSPSGMTNNGENGEGHAAEPWRYAVLPASEDPFRRWSPKEYIQNATTPTLIIHSQRDYRLDVSQGFELYTALQRLGVPSRFLYFPDEGHWVLKPKDSELWNAVVSDWCDRWTHTGKYAEGGE